MHIVYTYKQKLNEVDNTYVCIHNYMEIAQALPAFTCVHWSMRVRVFVCGHVIVCPVHMFVCTCSWVLECTGVCVQYVHLCVCMCLCACVHIRILIYYWHFCMAAGYGSDNTEWCITVVMNTNALVSPSEDKTTSGQAYLQHMGTLTNCLWRGSRPHWQCQACCCW